MGVVTIDPEDVGANSTVSGSVDLPGARIGDIVWVTPPSSMESGLLLNGASITDEDELTFSVRNTTAGEINAESREWAIMILKRSTPGGCEDEEEES